MEVAGGPLETLVLLILDPCASKLCYIHNAKSLTKLDGFSCHLTWEVGVH